MDPFITSDQASPAQRRDLVKIISDHWTKIEDILVTFSSRPALFRLFSYPIYGDLWYNFIAYDRNYGTVLATNEDVHRIIPELGSALKNILVKWNAETHNKTIDILIEEPSFHEIAEAKCNGKYPVSQ